MIFYLIKYHTFIIKFKDIIFYKIIKMSLWEGIRFFMNSLMDAIYEREMYMNGKSIYIE